MSEYCIIILRMLSILIKLQGKDNYKYKCSVIRSIQRIMKDLFKGYV